MPIPTNMTSRTESKTARTGELLGKSSSEVLSGLTGWRYHEIKMAIKDASKSSKGRKDAAVKLNTTEFRRLLLGFGVNWTRVKQVVPSSTGSYTAQQVVDMVQKEASAETVQKDMWDLFQHHDRQKDGTISGKIDAQTFYNELLHHGMSHEEINLLLYTYSQGNFVSTHTDRQIDVVDGKRKAIVRTEEFDVKTANHFGKRGATLINAKYEYAPKTSVRDRRLKDTICYPDLHRDLFPTDGWETAKHWQKESDELKKQLDFVLEKQMGRAV